METTTVVIIVIFTNIVINIIMITTIIIAIILLFRNSELSYHKKESMSFTIGNPSIPLSNIKQNTPSPSIKYVHQYLRRLF